MLSNEELEKARKIVKESGLVVRTPLLANMQHHFPTTPAINLYLKLENTQKTGSFKIRGLVNQINSLPADLRASTQELVTMSAGNYGKAFAFTCKLIGHKATVVMPESAPDDRQKLIEGFGASVVRAPTDQLSHLVDTLVTDRGAVFLHPFDDANLIAGHATAGQEILEDLPDPDVLLVCCGGGGLLAGIATAVRLSGRKDCRIYGVEPEGAPKMYKSFRSGHPVSIPCAKTIAAGLAPPYAGTLTYKICKAYADDIILVSDDEIKAAVKMLYMSGFVVEPSGSAAFAALLANKVMLKGGEKVVAVLTGGNVMPADLEKMFDSVN